MRKSILRPVAVLVVLFAAGWVVPTAVKAQGPLRRFSAEFKNFDITETFTSKGVCSPVAGPCDPFFSSNGASPGDDGLLVYSKTISVPSGVNTLYLTISAVGDDHFGAAEWLSCRIDGSFCNSGNGGAAGAPPGWLAVVKHFQYDTTYTTPDGTTGNSLGDGGGGTGDMHDNSVYYTWCIGNVSKGPHTLSLKMATSDSSNSNNFVFFEAAHFYIDASQTTNGCTAATPVGISTPVTGGAQ